MEGRIFIAESRQYFIDNIKFEFNNRFNMDELGEAKTFHGL